MDTVGLPLKKAIDILEKTRCKYTIMRTQPTRDFFKIDEDCLYVIRQRKNEDGSLELITAAKMRKEV